MSLLSLCVREGDGGGLKSLVHEVNDVDGYLDMMLHVPDAQVPARYQASVSNLKKINEALVGLKVEDELTFDYD
jgi:hypothetical protein